MGAGTCAFGVAVAASVGIAICSFESCRAQGGGEDTKKSQALWDSWDWNKVQFDKADGPYSYKSPKDLIPITGFVTKVMGDNADFRDCSGKVHNVKFSELKRIQRNCPPGSPILPWTVDFRGKIAPVTGYVGYVGDLVGEKKLDRAKLPKEYEQKVETAKPGTLLGISFPADNGERQKVYFIDQNMK